MPKSYRTLESSTPESRKDDILRAAVAAFAALSNPSKRDCNQIEDICLSLLPLTHENTRRFAAAALSDCAVAPVNLVRALCAEPAEICAPLLLRSPALAPVDLVAIIGKQGKEHARVIAKRKHLPNPVIEALALLDDPVTRERIEAGYAKEGIEKTLPSTNIKPASAEIAREFLREIMGSANRAPDYLQGLQDSDHVPNVLPREASRQLVSLALKDHDGLFVTAIADMSGLTFKRAQSLLRRTSPSELATVLKSFEIDGPTAYVVCSIFYPDIADSRAAIRLFLESHDTQDCDQARTTVWGWKEEELVDAFNHTSTANRDEPSTGSGLLKVS